MLQPQPSSAQRLRSWNSKRRLPILPLIEATLWPTNPHGKEPRPRGLKRQGLLYERKVQSQITTRLPGWSHFSGQWIRYQDADGVAYAQPDHIALSLANDVGFLIEAKLTRCADAQEQLFHLYLPLAQRIWPLTRWVLIEAVHNWRGPESRWMVAHPERLINEANPKPTNIFSWHWRP